MNFVNEKGELPLGSVLWKYRITVSDGKSYKIQHYDLEVIISVGYATK